MALKQTGLKKRRKSEGSKKKGATPNLRKPATIRGASVDRSPATKGNSAAVESTKESGDGMEYHQDKYLCAMVSLLSQQMMVLVIDPRVFRKDVTWELVTQMSRRVLHVCAMTAKGEGAPSRDDRSSNNAMIVSLVISTLTIVTTVIAGARNLGLDEEKLHADALTSKLHVSEGTSSKDDLMSIAESTLLLHESEIKGLQSDSMRQTLKDKTHELLQLLDPDNDIVARETARRIKKKVSTKSSSKEA